MAERECAYEFCAVKLTGRADRKYCSGACRVAAHRARVSDPVETGTGTPEPRRCDWCEEWIPMPRALNPLVRYCSNAHKQAYYRMCGGPPIPAAELAGLAAALERDGAK